MVFLFGKSIVTVFNLAYKSTYTRFLGVGPRATKVAIVVLFFFVIVFSPSINFQIFGCLKHSVELVD